MRKNNCKECIHIENIKNLLDDENYKYIDMIDKLQKEKDRYFNIIIEDEKELSRLRSEIEDLQSYIYSIERFDLEDRMDEAITFIENKIEYDFTKKDILKLLNMLRGEEK